MYSNNSVINSDEIGESSDALHCLTNVSNCCRLHLDNSNGTRNFYAPNNSVIHKTNSHLYISRGHKSILLHQKELSLENGIFKCQIYSQEVYFGIYTQTAGKVI